MLKILCDGLPVEIPLGTTYRELAEQLQPQYPHQIVLAKRGTKLRELRRTIDSEAPIGFLTTADRDGARVYERSMTMLLAKAVHDVLKGKTELSILFSVRGGLYIELNDRKKVSESLLRKLKQRMEELVLADVPFEKRQVHVEKARPFFTENGREDHAKLLRFRRSSYVNIYNIGDYSDYNYGYMVPSTGSLRFFDLMAYENGLILRLPDTSAPETVAPFLPNPKVFREMLAGERCSAALGIRNVADINEKIAAGEIEDLILIDEARQERDIAAIASQIAARPAAKCVMIAGPSSSGKTSFSNRLSVQLRARGLRPHPIEVDNYFKNREDTPKDANGEYDFEVLEALDVKTFNRDLRALLAGERVEIPSFNFQKGAREYKGNYLQLGAEDILVIEGIHCLNDALTESVPAEQKFRIYISALLQTNIDDHNRIPTTDGRLLRRMVRDARTRGAGARETISRWPSVRRGEEQNIFPYQENVDAVFNSSLVYELSVLKSYAEPLLFGIPEDAPEYTEAKRLLKFLDSFLAVDSMRVPQNSLLKEFIGGSIFKV